VDGSELRRLDPRAPRDALVEDVIGGDPLLRALFPDAFRSLDDVDRIEYRARTFAGSRWGVLVWFRRPLTEALAERGQALPVDGRAGAWPADRPAREASLGPRELLLAPGASLDDALRDAAFAPPVEVASGDLAAWRLSHVDEDFRDQEAQLPRELFLRARRWPSPAVIRLEVRARYADAASAERGLRHWEGLRRRLADDPLVGLLGMDRPLAERSVRLEGNDLTFVTTLRADELRFVLGAVAGMHGRPEPGPDDGA